MPKGATITGTVQDIRGREVLVVSPDEPRKHLRNIWVPRPSSPDPTARQVQVGDSVKLEYFSTNSYGLWFIKEIL